MWAQARRSPIWSTKKIKKDEPLANIGIDIYSAVFPHSDNPLLLLSSLLPKIWISYPTHTTHSFLYTIQTTLATTICFKSRISLAFLSSQSVVLFPFLDRHPSTLVHPRRALVQLNENSAFLVS